MFNFLYLVWLTEHWITYIWIFFSLAVNIPAWRSCKLSIWWYNMRIILSSRICRILSSNRGFLWSSFYFVCSVSHVALYSSLRWEVIDITRSNRRSTVSEINKIRRLEIRAWNRIYVLYRSSLPRWKCFLNSNSRLISSISCTHYGPELWWIDYSTSSTSFSWLLSLYVCVIQGSLLLNIPSSTYAIHQLNRTFSCYLFQCVLKLSLF